MRRFTTAPPQHPTHSDRRDDLNGLVLRAQKLRRVGIHAPKGRATRGHPIAGGFTGTFSTQATEHYHTIFDPEIEMLNTLATNGLTELTPTWRMPALALRYVPLVALRFLWRRAGLFCHVAALPHRGRCRCCRSDLVAFDRLQRPSRLKSLTIPSRRHAAVATASAWRAKGSAATAALGAAAFAVCNTSSSELTSALKSAAWRATQAGLTSCALAGLRVANALLFTSLADVGDSFEATRLRAERRLCLPFVYATRAIKALLSATAFAVGFTLDLLAVVGTVTLLAAHGAGALATAAMRHLYLCARSAFSRNWRRTRTTGLILLLVILEQLAARYTRPAPKVGRA